MSKNRFTRAVIALIQNIPSGKVASYGLIARLAGNPRAARQVSRVLHACSRNEDLPWHRVVNRDGRISLPSERGGDEQRRLLEGEGIVFGPRGGIDFAKYLWLPSSEIEQT